MCAAATSGSLAAEVQEKVAQKVQLPAGYWITWGGQFENLAAARQRLMIVVPGCFFLATRFSCPAAFPLALTGGVVALWLRDMPFSVSAASGLSPYPAWRC